MAANARTSKLYQENYNLRRAQICRHILVLPPHSLRQVFGTRSETQGIYVIMRLSLRSNRRSLSRQQGITFL